VVTPEHLTVGKLIERLEHEDPSRVVKVGFTEPHSYRGDYADLAFELATDVRIGDMLTAARSALGATYQGWKGGDYEMREYTYVWIVSEEGRTGESLGALLLELLLAQ
jgi:hypothetical protein